MLSRYQPMILPPSPKYIKPTVTVPIQYSKSYMAHPAVCLPSDDGSSLTTVGVSLWTN